MSVKLECMENSINTEDFENVFCRIFVPWDVMLVAWKSSSRL